MLGSEMLASTIWISLICSPVRNYWAGVWERKSSGAAALFPCLSLPTSASQRALRVRRWWSPHWRMCQNSVPGSEAAGLASWQALSNGKERAELALKWLIPADAGLQGKRPAASYFPALLNYAAVWGIALENKPKPQTKGPTFIITHARMHPQLLNCYMQLPSKLEGNYPNSVYNLCHFIL